MCCLLFLNPNLDAAFNRRKEGLKMLMVRVILGRCYLHKDEESLDGLPCKRQHCFTPDCTEHRSRFDSVVAGTNKRFLEFLLSDEDACYVQYCIEYDRIGDLDECVIL